MENALSGNESAARNYSFDVFDTAVCRLLHLPEHIHLIVGRKIRKRGIVDLSDMQWLVARANAEFQQRLTVEHREIKLEDIYACLLSSLNLTSVQARKAMEIELQEELRLIRPIGSTRQRVHALVSNKHPVTFLSDTYFTSAQVERLLLQSGYDGPIDVVTSCDARKSKMAGTLFGHLAGRQDKKGGHFQHLGDSVVSDVRNARANGWAAELFADSHWTTRERVIFASGKGDFLSSAIAGSARAARLGQEMPVKQGIATAAASVVGPLFCAYVLWVMLDVIARGGHTIHFLSRDGQILVQMCQHLARWLGVNIDARYTYASRQAFLLPALPDNDDGMINQALVLAYYDQITLSEALMSLGYSDNEIIDISHHSHTERHMVSGHLNESQRSALKGALLRKELLDPMRKRARVAREATMAYLEAEGFFSSSEAYIVDLGWRGNTQHRMQRVVGDRVRIIGYYMGLTNSVLGPEEKAQVWTTTVPLKTGLLEVMAAADHTSVKGFGFAEDGRPACVPPIAEDFTLTGWGARQQQEIAMRFVGYLTDAIELEYYKTAEVYGALEGAALDAYRHFRRSPTSAEAEAYGGIAHQADVNHLKSQELAGVVTSKDLLRHLFDKRSRAAVSSWYMGSIARSKNHMLPMLISNTVDRTIKFMARLEAKRKKTAAHRLARNVSRYRWKNSLGKSDQYKEQTPGQESQ